MELIRGRHNLSGRLRGCVITVGSFDGLHLGHRKLLQELKAAGQLLHLPAVVVTFEPPPKEFFSRKQTVPRLMRFREKWNALLEYNVDYLLCLQFNEALARLSPEDFVEEIVVNQLHAKAIIIGDDFRFGAKRAGDTALLKTFGEKWGFKVIEVPAVTHHGERISSTRVRAALQSGDLKLARALLKRPYRLCGKVVHGDGRGRQWGFPTANLHLHRSCVPVSGIFVVRAYGLGKNGFEGVASIGTRPTFNENRLVLEVYLFDFNENIYGKTLEIEFLHKLRDEVRYASVEALVDQIRKDVADARAYFSSSHLK